MRGESVRVGPEAGGADVTTPPDGTVYLATDGRWYRWPDPRPYPSQDAAERQARPYAPVVPDMTTAYAAAAPESTGLGRAGAYVGAVVIGLPALIGVVAMLTLPDHHPPGGGCEGIGFGCTPAPSSAAFFATVLSLVVTVPATALAWLLMWVLDRESAAFRDWPPSLKAGAVLAAYAVIALLVLLARSASSA